jgi:AraC-like DNA-binding protein
VSARQHVAFLGAPGVSYEEYLPPPELAPWVAVVWRITSSVPFELRIVPDGCMDIIRGDVIGSFSRPGFARFEPGDVSEGVRFHPGGFPALFGIPASELVDLRLPIADVAPRFRSLRRLAAEAERPDELARAAAAASSLRTLARDSGYSERQIRRRIVSATGHGPKQLMRIARMQRVLLHGRGESWARTAADHGYYDEAHMANDVRQLAGATPHTLLKTAVSSK